MTMELRSVQRVALDRYLRAVRIPFDAAAGLLRDDANAKLLIDRADATVRDVAGRVWRDDELRRDAERRRLAADERQRALRLKDVAERRSDEADAEFRRNREAAEQQRQHAQRQAAEQAARGKAAVRRTAAQTQAAVDKQAREARLDQLDEEAAALEKEEEALAAADETRRLRKAASATKAARKGAG